MDIIYLCNVTHWNCCPVTQLSRLQNVLMLSYLNQLRTVTPWLTAYCRCPTMTILGRQLTHPTALSLTINAGKCIVHISKCREYICLSLMRRTFLMMTNKERFHVRVKKLISSLSLGLCLSSLWINWFFPSLFSTKPILQRFKCGKQIRLRLVI